MESLTDNTVLHNGKYRITRVTSQDKFCITYLADQIKLGRQVHIKEFFLSGMCIRDMRTNHVMASSENVKEIVEKCKKGFFQEALDIAKSDHTNSRHIIDIFEENCTIYYVMECSTPTNITDSEATYIIQQNTNQQSKPQYERLEQEIVMRSNATKKKRKKRRRIILFLILAIVGGIYGYFHHIAKQYRENTIVLIVNDDENMDFILCKDSPYYLPNGEELPASTKKTYIYNNTQQTLCIIDDDVEEKVINKLKQAGYKISEIDKILTVFNGITIEPQKVCELDYIPYSWSFTRGVSDGQERLLRDRMNYDRRLKYVNEDFFSEKKIGARILYVTDKNHIDTLVYKPTEINGELIDGICGQYVVINKSKRPLALYQIYYGGREDPSDKQLADLACRTIKPNDTAHVCQEDIKLFRGIQNSMTTYSYETTYGYEPSYSITYSGSETMTLYTFIDYADKPDVKDYIRRLTAFKAAYKKKQ